MIYLIMVFSAIMPSLRSTGELSNHSPVSHKAPIFPLNMQMTDEIRERIFLDGLQIESLLGDTVEDSIPYLYPIAKKRKKTPTNIGDMLSHKPYEKMPFIPGRIFHKDTGMLKALEVPKQKMHIRETTTSLPFLLSNDQLSAKWKLVGQAIPKRDMIDSDFTTDSDIPENILFITDFKENIRSNVNATSVRVNSLRNKKISNESDGSSVANGELHGHSRGSGTQDERFTKVVDRKSPFSANEEEILQTNRRDRVKRSIRNKHNHENRYNRTVSVQRSSSEAKNSTDQGHVATEENGTSIDDDPPEIVSVTNIGNNTAAASTNTTSSRGQRRRRGRRRQHRQSKDLALWIDERQVKLFSGYIMEIFAIHDGHVLPYILDPNFEKHLPVIPFEVQSVNFTWQAGRKRYYYTFDRLYSHDGNILQDPVVSLPTQGRIPRKPKVFTVHINCTGNASGIAAFEIGLLIQTRRGKPLPGTPLRLKLRKECTQPSPDPECDEKCENGGVCDAGRRCRCPEGYMGQYCNTALCYPQCMNGGTCTTPGRCTCPPGYQGRHCEGGICRDKCENGGKCIQKDTCACPRGYYGNRCEFSKCVIPCINGGRCRNVNKCRCPPGFAGDHCEIVTGRSLGTTAMVRCSKKCRHGSCKGTTCQCQPGFTGRWCRRRGGNRKPVWL